MMSVVGMWHGALQASKHRCEEASRVHVAQQSKAHRTIFVTAYCLDSILFKLILILNLFYSAVAHITQWSALHGTLSHPLLLPLFSYPLDNVIPSRVWVSNITWPLPVKCPLIISSPFLPISCARGVSSVPTHSSPSRNPSFIPFHSPD